MKSYKVVITAQEAACIVYLSLYTSKTIADIISQFNNTRKKYLSWKSLC